MTDLFISKDIDKKILQVLAELQEQKTPSEEDRHARQSPPGMEERMLVAVRQKMAEAGRQEEKRGRIRRIKRSVLVAAAVLMLALLVGFRQEISEFVARFTITDYGTHLDVNRTAEVTGDTDFSQVTYTMPEGYELIQENDLLFYDAIWEMAGTKRIIIAIQENGGMFITKKVQQILTILL
ncbi:MAG: hypothetical protein QM287_06325 [Bacillota bacterium]|nr:hypothetical protein [Bacillota bacterium]